jgi:hypothetical protein
MDLSEADSSTPTSSSLGSDDGSEKIPVLKWWAGLLIYAVTNVGFLILFDTCSKITDLNRVFMLMAIYYGIALVLRFVLRNVLKLDKKRMPHFFWEPPFYPRRNL